MSADADRQLPATEQKLQKARDDGQAPRSRDLANLAVLGAGAFAVVLLTPTAFERLKLALIQQLRFDASTLAQTDTMMNRAQDMGSLGLMMALLFAVLVGAAAVVSTIGSGGWITSLKPITPDFSRLNPISGLGNLVSKQQLFNIAKLSVLTAILFFVTWIFLRDSMQRVTSLVMQPSAMALRDLGDWLISGVSSMMLVVFAAAVVDVPLQTFFHKSRLKMSHEEVKQEHKNAEGNPHIKSKIRQRAREIANRASVSKVPEADFILMNPTHYAVALRYDEINMNAPHVISKGSDMLAMRIRDIAREHDIPVLQSPVLARALYAHADLDQAIPSTLFNAVAQVLAYVYRLKAAMRGEAAMPGTLPELDVPPELDPHNPAAAAARARKVADAAD
ncbi:EscU/YscU/HrcU family type III secretion system export apparatus switch protein [Xylophilus sp. GOD-11R]|uniref:EscU/YscU/HrcU family type III secretion system export apparatus switch protein n=1 Tax=Xylophilus sp. GOD-11R TaxID=3089814 RepID=UPI00298C68D6|nr:EscU/YscU/HrcU family type III secretion system export apparatus switch protein [Xylophilus sp. GOD-11R]WPB57752.1 EscU/YscU/HrcU family type III secretion system export apparatus switch protein [Xylophilus sp. GOD-11R]